MLVFCSTSVLALIQYVCVLVMVSHSTSMLHSTGYGLPQCMCVLALFTVRVCTGHGLPQHVHVLAVLEYVCVLVMVSQHVCVLAVFTVRVCTGYVFPQHVCVLAVLQYVCVLVMFSHSTCVCRQFRSTWVYWSWSPIARVCASSSAVRGCTGYGFL